MPKKKKNKHPCDDCQKRAACRLHVTVRQSYVTYRKKVHLGKFKGSRSEDRTKFINHAKPIVHFLKDSPTLTSCSERQPFPKKGWKVSQIVEPKK
jgi:hypothetical protein